MLITLTHMHEFSDLNVKAMLFEHAQADELITKSLLQFEHELSEFVEEDHASSARSLQSHNAEKPQYRSNVHNWLR